VDTVRSVEPTATVARGPLPSRPLPHGIRHDPTPTGGPCRERPRGPTPVASSWLEGRPTCGARRGGTSRITAASECLSAANVSFDFAIQQFGPQVGGEVRESRQAALGSARPHGHHVFDAVEHQRGEGYGSASKAEPFGDEIGQIGRDLPDQFSPICRPMVERYSWTCRTAVDPSPTAAATRLTGLLRTSPTANTPCIVVAIDHASCAVGR
jgi:hypothetical protein